MSLLSFPVISSSGVLVALVTYIYQRRKYAKSVTRALGLEKFPTYVVRGVGYRLAAYLRPRLAARLSLRDFAINRLAASSAKVMVPAAIPVELNLDRMFVPLTAVSSEHGRVSAVQVAHGDEYRRVLLIGDPGSGKSTLVKRIYRDICQIAIIARQIGRIPVLIELKNLDVRTGVEGGAERRSLLDIVKSHVTSVQAYSGEDLFESFLNDGRVTVMLDGLDEVKTSDFDKVSEDISSFCEELGRRNPKNQIVLTTRRQLYVNLPEEFSSKFESHLTLEPFTPDDMYEFLSKWPYKSHPHRELARIFANLSAQPNIRSMCQTPLILAMYVATDQITGGEELPETRPDFYRAVTDELLVRRRGRQLGLTTGLNLLRRNRQQILGRLALEHLLDGKQSRNTLRFDAAVRIIKEVNEGISDFEAGRLLRELSRDTGLFTEEKREETLRFVHLTFCEFLAGQFIAQGAVSSWCTITSNVENGNEAMDSRRAVERFSEVIVFATALEDNRHIRRERVRWVLEHGGWDLALRVILDTQPYDDGYAVDKLMEIAESVARFHSSDRNEQWFHLLRQVAVVLRDRELVDGATSDVQTNYLARFFMQAANESTAELKNLILPYLRLDPAGALQLIYSMGEGAVSEYSPLLIKALDEPAVLAHALAQFSIAEEGARTWGRILALGSIHHRSVLRRLRLMQVEEILERKASAAAGRRNGWHRCWLTRGSVLGEVLEAGIAWPGRSALLAATATISPRRNRATDMLACVSIGAVVGAVLTSVAVAGVGYLLAPMPIVYACLVAVGLTLSSITVSAFQRNSWCGTKSLLRYYDSTASRVHSESASAIVSMAARNPSVSTLQLMRIARGEPHPEGIRFSWRERFKLALPAETIICANSRMSLIRYMTPYLLMADLNDSELSD
ncbi:NACHT domain-containing protein [Lentzea sp. NPDC006480]|uniref:NACHT domain-containing protein n=1 Tax=Lentzea sp. NPDC006480 TaxID=3157176 RepID=UPI0033A07E3F